MSHELRTPLTAMTAVSDVLGDSARTTGDAAAAAQLVRREIFHLNRLVDDLIEISLSLPRGNHPAGVVQPA